MHRCNPMEKHRRQTWGSRGIRAILSERYNISIIEEFAPREYLLIYGIWSSITVTIYGTKPPSVCHLNCDRDEQDEETICPKPDSFPPYSCPMFSDISSWTFLNMKITHSSGTDRPMTAKERHRGDDWPPTEWSIGMISPTSFGFWFFHHPLLWRHHLRMLGRPARSQNENMYVAKEAVNSNPFTDRYAIVPPRFLYTWGKHISWISLQSIGDTSDPSPFPMGLASKACMYLKRNRLKDTANVVPSKSSLALWWTSSFEQVLASGSRSQRMLWSRSLQYGTKD